MDFIARNTTIPVPRVLDLLVIDGSMHIVQEYIDASVLADVWPRMDSGERDSCMFQLKGYVDQLRALVSLEPGRVQAVDGTGCIDDRLYPGTWGPFDSFDAFNSFFSHDIVRQRPEDYPDAQEPLSKTRGRTWRTVFAHGDLGPHNILWKDGRIVSIIDWECAGWFPEYWEYTRSYFTSACSLPGWWEMFKGLMDQYPEELEVERCLSAYFIRV
jgi:serine/threonine protein kinase